MNKVELRFSHDSECADGVHVQDLLVLINGEPIASGSYGGEPEDNVRSRDYKRVETALINLAKGLGAEVVVTEENYTT